MYKARAQLACAAGREQKGAQRLVSTQPSHSHAQGRATHLTPHLTTHTLPPTLPYPTCPLHRFRSAREQELDNAKFKDVCGTLPEEYVDSCLAHSFTALLGVLRAHHQMVLWLAKAVESAGEEVKAAEVAEAKAKQAVSAAAANSNPFADDAVDAAVAGGESSGLDEAERALQVEKRRREAREREEAVTVATEALAAAGERKKRLTQMQSAVGQARGSVWDLMQRRVRVCCGGATMASPSSSSSISRTVWSGLRPSARRSAAVSRSACTAMKPG